MDLKLSTVEVDTWGLGEVYKINALLDMREDYADAKSGFDLIQEENKNRKEGH